MNPVLEAILAIGTIASLLAVPTYADWLLRKRRTARASMASRAVPADPPALVAVQASAAEAIPFDPGPVVLAPREDV